MSREEEGGSVLILGWVQSFSCRWIYIYSAFLSAILQQTYVTMNSCIARTEEHASTMCGASALRLTLAFCVRSWSVKGIQEAAARTPRRGQCHSGPWCCWRRCWEPPDFAFARLPAADGSPFGLLPVNVPHHHKTKSKRLLLKFKKEKKNIKREEITTYKLRRPNWTKPYRSVTDRALSQDWSPLTPDKLAAACSVKSVLAAKLTQDWNGFDSPQNGKRI